MRSRRALLVLVALTVAAGLASRHALAPAMIREHAGDMLYAVLIYWLVAWVRPGARPLGVAVVAWGVCAGIEASQAWHAPWLDAARSTRLGALVLGRGFLWVDLGRYAVGAAGVAGAELAADWARRRGGSSSGTRG